MMNLLIDIGNTNIKTAISSNNKISKIQRFEYSKNNFEGTFRSIFKNNYFDNVGISCLNKEYKKIINKIILEKLNLKPFFIDFKNKLPIKIKYERTLGTDRICSAVAAFTKYQTKKNILVIDFGTATTYNLIINKNFTGGLITPGIKTSLLSLNSNANLPLTKVKKINQLISNKTKENILSGAINQSLFTTEGVISSLKRKYKNLFVVSTGGLAELIYEKTSMINKFEKNLVLEGINIILNYNLKKI